MWVTSFDPSPKCSTIVELAIRCERSTATGEACAEPADPTHVVAFPTVENE